MKLGGPIKIATAVHQLRVIGARVTVITTGNQVVLVDTGAKGSLSPIADGLSALNASLSELSLIVLTHYHPDHSGSLDKVVEASSGKVAVHHEDAGIVRGKEPMPSLYRNNLLEKVTQPLLSRLYGAPVEVDHLLNDQDRLPVQEDITVIHTPGHTAGSICLYMASKGVLIVGDAMQYRLRRLGPPAASVTASPQQALESLEKLLSLDFDTICFSHFPPLRSGARPALQKLLDKTVSR